MRPHQQVIRDPVTRPGWAENHKRHPRPSVGQRALCRLARVLQTHCRGIDTAARHGGDEFALILPEAEREAGLQVAQRILDGLADDREQPALSVSIGIAIYPEDGDAVETLLAAADRDLYEMKRRSHSKTTSTTPES